MGHRVGEGLQFFIESLEFSRSVLHPLFELLVEVPHGFFGRFPTKDFCFEIGIVGGQISVDAGQVQKYIHLVGQHGRIVRFDDVIDPTGFIASKNVLLIGIESGQEDDGQMAGLFFGSQIFGQFVAIHFRHVHIQNGQRKVMIE